jgi:hypothetical protein
MKATAMKALLMKAQAMKAPSMKAPVIKAHVWLIGAKISVVQFYVRSCLERC